MNDFAELIDQADADVDTMLVVDPQTITKCALDWISELPGHEPQILDNGLFGGMQPHGEWIRREDIEQHLNSLLFAIRENAQ